MKIIKKDFVNEDTISFCGHGKRLSSGKAYFMQKDNGEMVYGGKQCALEHSTTNLSLIPDFTRSLIARREGSNSNSSNGANAININDLDKSKAITYMLLRQEKLNHFKYRSKSLSYSILHKYHAEYIKTYDLTDDAVNHILNIEKKLSGKKTNLKNLSACYAYDYILGRTLAYLEATNNNNGIEFVSGLQKSLYANCSLTLCQIDGLSKWLKYLPQDLAEAKLRGFNYDK